MRVAEKTLADQSITGGSKYPFMLAKEADRRLWKLQKSEVITWRSPARFGSLTASDINKSGADVVHLHWVTDGFLSVETIGKIKKPIIWSLCDAWAFSGTEHYATESSTLRSREGYTKRNRNPTDSGFDLDRWTWERKVNAWKQPMHLLPASTWLTEATATSKLMGSWPITRIPHIVDTNVFTPSSALRASTKPQLLFLTSAGIHDSRKGWDLLALALEKPELETTVHVTIVGPVPTKSEQAEIRAQSQHEFTFHGEARGDHELVELYRNADITIVPSREDNMPITAMESQSCGTPVVAFAIGGLLDIVQPGLSGYLAKPEDPTDLAIGINKVLTSQLRESTREHASATWSPAIVVPQLLRVYERALT